MLSWFILKSCRFDSCQPVTGCQTAAARDRASKIDGGMQSQQGEGELISAEERGTKSERKGVGEGEKSKEFKLSQHAGRSVNRKDGREKRGDRQREQEERMVGQRDGALRCVTNAVCVCLRSQHDSYSVTPFWSYNHSRRPVCLQHLQFDPSWKQN